MAQSTEDVAGARYRHKKASKLADLAGDTRPAIERLYSAWSDLKAEGWREITYAPEDGTEVEIIECGSTGIHRAAYQSGSWWADGEWPSNPILFRLPKTARPTGDPT